MHTKAMTVSTAASTKSWYEANLLPSSTVRRKDARRR